MEVKAALMGEDYEKLKNWQREAFHKQMIGGFKETKEADDGFRKAQKPWAKKLKEVCFKASRFLPATNLLLQNEPSAQTVALPLLCIIHSLPCTPVCVLKHSREHLHALAVLPSPWLCLREVSDTQASAETEPLCRHDLLNQHTQQRAGRK